MEDINVNNVRIKFISTKSDIENIKHKSNNYYEECEKQFIELKEIKELFQKLSANDKVGLIQKLKLFKEKIQSIFKWKREQTEIEKEKLPFQCQLSPNELHEKLKDAINENNELKEKDEAKQALLIAMEIILNNLYQLLTAARNELQGFTKSLPCKFDELQDAIKKVDFCNFRSIFEKTHLQRTIDSLESRNAKLMEEKVKLQETTNDLKSDLLRKELDLKEVQEKCCKLQEQLEIAHSRKTNNLEFGKRMLEALLTTPNTKRKMENQPDKSLDDDHIDHHLKKHKGASNQLNINQGPQNASFE